MVSGLLCIVMWPWGHAESAFVKLGLIWMVGTLMNIHIGYEQRPENIGSLRIWAFPQIFTPCQGIKRDDTRIRKDCFLVTL